jgi:hypothetical protein
LGGENARLPIEHDQRRIVPSKKARTRCGGAGQAIRTSQQTIDSALLIAVVTPLRGATPHAARGWKSGIAILVGLIILAAIVNGSKNQNGAGVAPLEHSAGQQ